MTRKIAIVGTSNIGALKYATDTIAAEFPDLAVTFWGLPGGKFGDCRVNAEGIFKPFQEDGELLNLAQRINGTASIDLKGFDATLVIGDTLGMPQTLFVAAQYDVTDWPSRRDRPLLSGPAFNAAMDEAITVRADALTHQFAGIAPLFVALAPYPTVAVTRRGPHRQDPYASVAAHPELARIHGQFRAALSAALAARGLTFVPQPDATMAGPFLTRPEYAQGAMDFRQQGRILHDHRHMNAAFGASLFRAFALALGPDKTGTAPTPQIKE